MDDYKELLADYAMRREQRYAELVRQRESRIDDVLHYGGISLGDEVQAIRLSSEASIIREMLADLYRTFSDLRPVVSGRCDEEGIRGVANS